MVDFIGLCADNLANSDILKVREGAVGKAAPTGRNAGGRRGCTKPGRGERGGACLPAVRP